MITQEQKDILRSNLKALLRFLCWRQEDLASELGVSRQTVSTILMGKCNFTTMQYLAISRVVEIRAENLFGSKRIIKSFFEIPDFSKILYQKVIDAIPKGSEKES